VVDVDQFHQAQAREKEAQAKAAQAQAEVDALKEDFESFKQKTFQACRNRAIDDSPERETSTAGGEPKASRQA
jgi:hypothetical protein